MPTRVVCAAVISVLAGISVAHGDADGPDFWSVRGVSSGDVLIMHSAPSASASKIGEIPHDARGLKNLGCRGGPTFDQWREMTSSERQEAAKNRWCDVEYDSLRGWVAGRFLTE